MNLFKVTSLAVMVAFASFAANALQLSPVKNEKGKWGYADENGTLVIKYKYDEADYFVNGRAQVKKNDCYGFINESGTEIIPVKYNIIERLNDEVYKVAAGGKVKDGVLENEKYGFIDYDGKTLLSTDYDEIGQFKHGVAYLMKNRRYGYVNDKFKIIIPVKYGAVGSFNNQAITWVCTNVAFDKDGTFSGNGWGVYDIVGNVVLPDKFKSLGYCSENTTYGKRSKKELEKLHRFEKTVEQETGYHFMYMKYSITKRKFSTIGNDAVGLWASKESSAYKNGLYDISGVEIVKPGKYYLAYYPSDDMMMIYNKDKGYNFINMSTGKKLFKKDIYGSWGFRNGVAVIQETKGKWCMINTNGQPVSATYNHIFPKKNGIYIVKGTSTDGKWSVYGAINDYGTEVIPVTNALLFPESEGLMARRELNDKLCGFCDNQGNWVIPPKYTNLYSFQYGLADVKTEDGWGLITPDGKEVVKCKWGNTGMRDENSSKYGIFWVSVNPGTKEKPSAFKILDMKTDKVIDEKEWKWYRSFGKDFENVAFAGHDKDHIGVIDLNGNIIIPPVFNFTQNTAAYKMMQREGKSVWEEFDTFRIKLYSNKNRNKSRLNEIVNPNLWDY